MEASSRPKRIRGVDDVSEEFSDLVAASDASKMVENPWRKLFQRKYRPHLTMAIAIPFFQQLTGINVIMFYAPVLFKTIGFGDNASLMSAVITGVVNVGDTLVSIYGVDRCGRRFLFLKCGVQMLMCQVIVAVCIVNGEADNLPRWYAKVAQARNGDPFLWAMQLGTFLEKAGQAVPSVELARLLVSHLCWENNFPSARKFLEKAIGAYACSFCSHPCLSR